MREFAVPASVTVEPDENLSDMVWTNADRYGGEELLRRRDGDGWRSITAGEFAVDVAATAKGLLAAGIRPGERVGLLSATRYEWTVCDYAIWAAGGVTVPVYQTSSTDQIRWILSDAGCRAVILETAAHADAVAGIAGDLAELEFVWQLDDDGMSRLAAEGAVIPDADLLASRRNRGADDLASIVYTSGTTGRPKGCEITHRNLLFEVRTIGDDLDFIRPGGCTLLFLPLAHVFARIVQCGTIYHRATLVNIPDTKTLVPDLKAVRPSYVLAVPRVFEKVYNSARAQARGWRARVFAAADRTAVAWSQASSDGRPGPVISIRRAVYDRLVFHAIRAALGGRCTAAISGGAPLGARLAHFFRGVGVTVYEGYGLTETTAGTTVNMPRALRIGTVGRPVPGMAVRIADDGEIEFRGPLVFNGYWNNPDATAAAVQDGWFATGDLGSIDDGGFLSITGRKKELLVTAAGKNVAPAVLEDRLRAHPLISQCMVVGDGQPFIAALITLDPEFLDLFKVAHGTPAGATAGDLADDPGLRAAIQEAVDDANLAVSRAESIRAFVILDGDFTEAAGELTPSGKLRRNAVLARYADEISRIYGGPPPGTP